MESCRKGLVAENREGRVARVSVGTEGQGGEARGGCRCARRRGRGMEEGGGE